MNYPLVSIVVATLNSQKTLSDALKSIKMQSYPQDKIEILVIDGGSEDKTIDTAMRFKCRILKNPKVDQVYAKHLGWLNSRGKYIVFLDSDEKLADKNSIREKVLLALGSKKVKVVVSSGYDNSRNSVRLNSYVNEFGDPFSFFMYRISKDKELFLEELKKRGKIISENSKAVIFDFSGQNTPPFIELTSMGVLIDRRYVKSNFTEVFKNVSAHTHLFYILNLNRCLFAVMKHDGIIHESIYSLSSYLKKINSRIKNNIYTTNMGYAGFAGREKYQPYWYRVKKLLFIFYVFLFLPLIADGLFLLIKRKKPVYLMHIFLSFYALFSIMYYYLLKTFGIKVRLAGYGT